MSLSCWLGAQNVPVGVESVSPNHADLLVEVRADGKGVDASSISKCPSQLSACRALWRHGWLLSSPLACFWAYAYAPDGCTSWKSDLWEIRGFFLIMKIVMLVEHYGRIIQQHRPSPHSRPQVQLVKGRTLPFPRVLQSMAL